MLKYCVLIPQHDIFFVEDNCLNMTVNCLTGLVSWQMSTHPDAEPGYSIYVTYECDGNGSYNVSSIDDYAHSV